ncbi:MAG: hypothetical protein GX303_04025 [Clostridiales bacterium]|nr:hypothetical protein [Clostridiales bacterium]
MTKTVSSAIIFGVTFLCVVDYNDYRYCFLWASLLPKEQRPIPLGYALSAHDMRHIINKSHKKTAAYAINPMSRKANKLQYGTDIDKR